MGRRVYVLPLSTCDYLGNPFQYYTWTTAGAAPSIARTAGSPEAAQRTTWAQKKGGRKVHPFVCSTRGPRVPNKP